MNKLIVVAIAVLISCHFEWSAFAEPSQSFKSTTQHLPLPRSKQPLSREMIEKLHSLPVIEAPAARSRSARLTTLTVSLSTDNNPGGIGDVGDLRYAINTMNQDLSVMADDYAIVFASPMTIQLNGILPIINNSANPVNITIGNPGPTATVTIDGNNGAYPGFFIPMGNVTIQNIIFQNLSAKGGDGGNGISGGGGGLGAGGAIYAPQAFLNGSNPSISLFEVSISNTSAIGGAGGSYIGASATGNEGGGGGGGFWGNGGSILTTGQTGGAGGGGFGGDGGNVTTAGFSSDLGGGGGGGGIGSRATMGTLTNLGHGGSDQDPGMDGNGFGLSITAGGGGGGLLGGARAGGGGGGNGLTGFVVAGGGGGGSAGANGLSGQGNVPPIIVPFAVTPSGGSGGDGAGGGGGGLVSLNISNDVDGQSGSGGYGGGGGGAAGVGAFDFDYSLLGGAGGLGGGGGGGGVNHSGVIPADGGNSLGGGGGAGGGPSNGVTALGGTDVGNLGGGAGGAGANTYGMGFGGGGGGGGSGLGGAIFVDSNLNFILEAKPGVPTTFNTLNTTVQAGVHGTGGPGAVDGTDGSALGSSIFLRTGSSLTFMAQNVNDILTLGTGVGFVDDTSFGAGGTSVMVRGNGTVVYNGTTSYEGTVVVNNANLKVNGQINQAPVFVCRNVGFSAQRGTLSGAGIITGNVFANSGTVSPGPGNTLSIGSLTLSSADPGNNTLGSAVSIDIDSGGTSLVSVTGQATLAGVLQIKIDPTAASGTYTLLTSTGIIGTFDIVTFTGVTPPSYTLSYLPVSAPTYVELTFDMSAVTQKVIGSGKLAGTNGPVEFKVNASKTAGHQITASMSYKDMGVGVHFDNPVITTFNSAGGVTTLSGTVHVLGKNPKKKATISVTLTNNPSPTPDQLTLTLGNGYSISGNLTSGEITNP